MIDLSNVTELGLSRMRIRRATSSSIHGSSIVAKLLLFLCVVLLVTLPFCVSFASASTGYVDGISDQSLPAWDGGFPGYFGGFFQHNWINPTPHIQYARYVTQWNAMTEASGGPNANGNYRERFEAWLGDAAGMGLILDVSLTSYNGVYPASSAAYKTQVLAILKEADEALKHPISYLEAWNEPNGQGNESEVNAAHFTNEAYAACESVSPKCTILAGNAEDNTGAKAYEEKYRANLNPVPTIWGIHPYNSVEHMEESYYTKAVEGLPSKGSGDQIWFSEVAARRCTPSKNNEEVGQAERAKWLVDTLMRNQKPEHVFYWEFLLKSHLQPSCAETDDALYVPSEGDPNAEDRPRAAASYIYGGSGFPWSYTGAAVSLQPKQASLTGSIYTGGILAASYHFEYGTTASYGAFSSEGSVSASLGRAGVTSVVGLEPGTTYYYRLVAWNSEGADFGEGRILTTPGPVEAVTGAPPNLQEEEVTLDGTVNPRGYDAKYYFQYGTSTSYTSSTSEGDAGAGGSPFPVSTTITGLEPATVYHYRLVATSGGITSYGSDKTARTLSNGLSATVDDSNTVFFAFEGPNHSLYVVDRWGTDGTWHGPLQESGSGTTYSAPTSTVDQGNNVFFGFEGSSNSLQVVDRWGTDGTWHGPLQESGFETLF